MKALVLGATGHIGNAIARELLAHGYQVTATSRRPAPAASLLGLPVCYAAGDSDTPGQLHAWVAGHDLVVDAAAPYALHPFAQASKSEGDPLGHAARRTEALLEAVRAHDTRLVYVSSFTTLAQRQSISWQNRIARRLHPYFAIKELIESRVLTAARAGMPAIVVNPTLCLGPWDSKAPEYCFVPRLLHGEVALTTNHIVNVIDVRDLAAGVILALNAQRYAEPIALCGHNIPVSALSAWICEIGGAPPPRLCVSADLGLLPAYMAEAALALAGRAAPLPSLAMMLLCQHDWVAPGAAQRDLGIAPRPLSQTLSDSIEWYRALGYC